MTIQASLSLFITFSSLAEASELFEEQRVQILVVVVVIGSFRFYTFAQVVHRVINICRNVAFSETIRSCQRVDLSYKGLS